MPRVFWIVLQWFFLGVIVGALVVGCPTTQPRRRTRPRVPEAAIPPPAPALPSNLVTNTFAVGWDDREDIAHVNLYIGTNSGQYFVRITTTTNPMTVTLVRVRATTNYIAATAVNTLGMESLNYSKEITFPYNYQWLQIGWGSTQAVTLQFSPNLIDFSDFTNVTGTGITFDIPQWQQGMFRAINRGGTNRLNLSIKPK